MIRRLFCIAIIVLGSFLDIYFYAFRFSGDGIMLPIAITMAAALEILLAFAVYNAHSSYLSVCVAVALTIFATVQTSAGQTFALLYYTVTTGEKIVEAGDNRLTLEAGKNLDRLSIEADAISRQLTTLSSMEDRANYSATIRAATYRLESISKERADNMRVISEQSKTRATDEKAAVKNMSIYDFYASMPRWSGIEWIKFIFHTILSAFIALMTPFGILTWNKKGEIVKLKKIRVDKKDVELFVSTAWYKIRGKTWSKILPEIAYNDLMARNGVTVTIGVYQELVKRCEELGIVKADGEAVIIDEKQVVEMLMS